MVDQNAALVVTRTIRASAERLFAAWTTPAQLEQWWGPKDVRCSCAEVDLRVGGRYRIANDLPDGNTVWIEGEFETITPPHKLVYTWRLAGGDAERVTVQFNARDEATEVIVVHERIANIAAREEHERGWIGCLDGLADLLA